MLAFGVSGATAGEAAMCGYGWNHGWNGTWGWVPGNGPIDVGSLARRRALTF